MHAVHSPFFFSKSIPLLLVLFFFFPKGLLAQAVSPIITLSDLFYQIKFSLPSLR